MSRGDIQVPQLPAIAIRSRPSSQNTTISVAGCSQLRNHVRPNAIPALTIPAAVIHSGGEVASARTGTDARLALVTLSSVGQASRITASASSTYSPSAIALSPSRRRRSCAPMIPMIAIDASNTGRVFAHAPSGRAKRVLGTNLIVRTGRGGASSSSAVVSRFTGVRSPAQAAIQPGTPVKWSVWQCWSASPRELP